MEDTRMWALQQALFERLSEIGLAVYDHVPKKSPLPYLVIGQPQVTPFDTNTSKGEKISVVIHAWSEYPGKKEAMICLQKVLQFLSYKPLEVDGLFEFRRSLNTPMTVFDDLDGRLRHGVVHVETFIKQGGI